MEEEQVYSRILSWQTVNNTVSERMIDSSLLHNLIRREKLKTRTKILTLLLQKYPKLEDDEQYRMLKTIATKNISLEDECEDNVSDSDENFMYLHQCESAWQKSIKACVNKIKVDIVIRPKPKKRREKRIKKTTVVVKPKRVYNKKSVLSTSRKKKSAQLKLTTMKNAFKILTDDNNLSITNDTEIEKNNDTATSDLTSLFENINTGAQKRKRKSLLQNSFDLSQSNLCDPIAQSTPLTQRKVEKSQKKSSNQNLEFIKHLANKRKKNKEDKDNSCAKNPEPLPPTNIAESMQIVNQDQNTCERILPTVVCNEIVQKKYKVVEKRKHSLESEERTPIDGTDDVGSSLENDGLSDTEKTFTMNNISSFESENDIQTLNLDKSIKKRKKKASKVISRVRGSKNLNLIDNNESCSSIETEQQISTTLDCERSNNEPVEDDQDDKENTISNLPPKVTKSLKIKNKKLSPKKKLKISDFFKPKSKNIDESTLKNRTQTKVHDTNENQAQEKKETNTKNLTNSPRKKCFEFVDVNTTKNLNPTSPHKQSVENTDSGNESLSEKDDKNECLSNKITDSDIDKSNKLNENADEKREESTSSSPGILDSNKFKSKTTKKISQLIDFMDRDTSSDEELDSENHEGSTEEETRVSKLKKLNLITNGDYSSDEEEKQDETKSDNDRPDTSLDTSDDYIYASQDICNTNNQQSKVKKLNVIVNDDSKSNTESLTDKPKLREKTKSKNESSIGKNSKYEGQGVSESEQKNSINKKINSNCVDVSKLRKKKHKSSVGENSESDNQGVEESNSDHTNVQRKQSKKVRMIDEERKEVDRESLGEEDHNSAEITRVSQLRKLNLMNDESSCDSASLSQVKLKSYPNCVDVSKLRKKTKTKHKNSIGETSESDNQGVEQSNSDRNDLQQKNSTIDDSSHRRSTGGNCKSDNQGVKESNFDHTNVHRKKSKKVNIIDEERIDIDRESLGEEYDNSAETTRVSKLKKLNLMNDESSCDSASLSQVKLKSNPNCVDVSKLRKKTKTKHKNSIGETSESDNRGVEQSNSDRNDLQQKNSTIDDLSHRSSTGESSESDNQGVEESNSDHTNVQRKKSKKVNIIDEERIDIDRESLGEEYDNSAETTRVSKLKKLNLMNDESSCDSASLSQVKLKSNPNCEDVSKLRKKIKTKHKNSIGETSESDNRGVEQSNSDHTNVQRKKSKKVNVIDEERNDIDRESLGKEYDNSAETTRVSKLKKLDFMNDESSCDSASLSQVKLKPNSKSGNEPTLRRKNKSKRKRSIEDNSEDNDPGVLKSNSVDSDLQQKNSTIDDLSHRSSTGESSESDNQGVEESNSDHNSVQRKKSKKVNVIDEERNDIDRESLGEEYDNSAETTRVSKLKKLDFMNDESSCDSASLSQVKLKPYSKSGNEPTLRRKNKSKRKRPIEDRSTDNDEGVLKSNSDDSDLQQKNSTIEDERNAIDQDSQIEEDDYSAETTRVSKLEKLNLNMNHDSSSDSESLSQVNLKSSSNCVDEPKLRKKSKSKRKRSIGDNSKDNDEGVSESNSVDSDLQQKNSIIDEETNDIELDFLEEDDDSCETIRVFKCKKIDSMDDETSCDSQSSSRMELKLKPHKKTGISQSNPDQNNSKKRNIIDEERNNLDQESLGEDDNSAEITRVSKLKKLDLMNDESSCDTESLSQVKLKSNPNCVDVSKLRKKTRRKHKNSIGENSESDNQGIEQSNSDRNNIHPNKSKKVNIIEEERNHVDQEDDNSSEITRVAIESNSDTESSSYNMKLKLNSNSVNEIKLHKKTISKRSNSDENNSEQVNTIDEEINDIDQESPGEEDDNSSETTRVAKLKKLNLIRDSDLSSDDEEVRAPLPHYVKTQVYDSQDECDENQIMEEQQRVSKLKRLNLTTNDDSSSDEEEEVNNSSLKKLDSIRHSINTIVDELLRSNNDKSLKVVEKVKKKRKPNPETEGADPKLNENENKKDSVSELKNFSNNQIETNHMIQNYESLTEEDGLSCDETRVSKLKRLNLIRDSDLSSDEEIVLHSKVRQKNKMKPKSKMKKLSNSEDNSISERGEKLEPIKGILKNHNHQNMDEGSNLGKNKRITFETISTEDDDLTSDLDPTPVKFQQKISPKKKDRMNNLNERPQTLEDLITAQILSKDKTQPTFVLSDISENDEVYMIDVPLQMKMDSLVGEEMILTRDKLQFGKHKYSVNHKFITHSCVFHTGNRRDPHKAVNITPASFVRIGRKLPESTSMNTSFKTDYRHEKKNLQNSELGNNDDLMNFQNENQHKDLDECEAMDNPSKRSKTRKTSKTENKVRSSAAKRRKIATATTSSYI